MKRIVSFKHMLILALCFISSIWATRDTDQCSSGCFDGCLSVQVQAGVVPIIWHHRDNFNVVSCNAVSGCPTSTVGPVIPLFGLPSFHKLFRLPWTVGGKIGYLLSDCSEVYVEANYRQASAKKTFTATSTVALPLFTLQSQVGFNNLSKYRFYDAYVGVRYYFDNCWCAGLSFFIGGQVGVVHHKAIDGTLTFSSITNPCPTFTTSSLTLFKSHTNVAGGGNFGLDFDVCDCFSVVLTAQVLATCAPSGNRTISFDGCTADQVLPELRISNIIIGGLGSEIFFPITLGVKYNF